MISISMPVILGLLMVVPLTALIFLWLYDEEKRDSKKILPTRKVMSQCDICLMHFTRDKQEKFIRCPRCGNLMEVHAKRKKS